jgi:uncharacterized protein (DUF983 family)
MTATATTLPDTNARPLKPALMRGFRGLCPACGRGRLMQGYLGIRANCAECGQDYTAQRADDGPAYMTILVVGHLMAPALLWAFLVLRPDPVMLALSFTIGCVALSLFLLPRFKGALVALQWAKRMHGFGADKTQ